MNVYIRLLGYIRPYVPRIVLASICMIIFSACNGVTGFLVGPALGFIFNPDKFEAIVPSYLKGFIVLSRDDMMMFLPAAIILLFLVKNSAAYGQIYLMSYVGQRVIVDLRNAVYRHVQHLSISFFTKNPTGLIISRVTNDISLVQNSVSTAVTALLRDTLSVITLVFVVFYLDWKMAALAILIFPLAVVPVTRFGRKMRKSSVKGQVSFSRMTILLHETISGARIVKAFGMERYEEKRFEEEVGRLFKQVMKVVKVQALSSPMMEVLGAIGFSSAILYGSVRIANGTLTPENFMSFFASLFLLYQPIKGLSTASNTIQEGIAAGTRVFAILDTEQEVRESSSARAVDRVSRDLVFKDVSFRYENAEVLGGINLSVRAGETIAIVGPSGAGKTTLVNLIPRYYDVTSGSISIDGTDIREIKIASLRSLIGIVTQQTILFNDTVMNNIAYGDVRKPGEMIIAAARAANAHEFISNLPGGYDSMIGEGGAKLSGGERQRIAIARALLKDAPILILDEATSSLDTGSEEEVQKALDILMKNRTTFVIAHRLSTVRNADRIIVVSGGRIIEEGRHDDLLAKNGEYARLYNKQFRDEPLGEDRPRA
jgi:subfamily B ATP-binding cassette protein MsbA